MLLITQTRFFFLFLRLLSVRVYLILSVHMVQKGRKSVADPPHIPLPSWHDLFIACDAWSESTATCGLSQCSPSLELCQVSSSRWDDEIQMEKPLHCPTVILSQLCFGLRRQHHGCWWQQKPTCTDLGSINNSRQQHTLQCIDMSVSMAQHISWHGWTSLENRLLHTVQ